MSLGTFMAATRRLESGAYDGNYTAMGRPVKGDRARGAYQIMSKNWKSWAKQAGVSGADWRDPGAQDRVAAHWMQRYFQRYGNWDLVAVAWYAGAGNADKIARRGYSGPESIRNRHIRGYVQKIRQFRDEAQQKGFTRPPGTAGSYSQSGSGWLFPVAGKSEWSKGSYMPTEETHRGRTHAAVDIYAQSGTPIVAPVGGTVINTGKGKIGGNFVSLRGADGNVYYFAHMQKTPVVADGQVINAGQHLGFVGRTGSARSTSPHLHFSVRNQGGQQVNPISFLESAEQGGGAFNAQMSGKMGMPKTSQFTSMISGMIGAMSNQIAGGERVDYQTLGLEVEGEGEPDATQPRSTVVAEEAGAPDAAPLERKASAQLEAEVTR